MMKPLEKYRIRGNYTNNYNITDVIPVGITNIGSQEYSSYSPAVIVTDKNELINELRNGFGYVVIHSQSDIVLEESDLPLEIHPAVIGILSYQDTEETAYPPIIRIKRYNENDEAQTAYLCQTHGNATDIIGAGIKNTPFKTLRYALSHLGSKTKLCILDSANYSAESKINLQDIPENVHVFSNYYPTMPELYILYAASSVLFTQTFSGLTWNVKNVTAGQLSVNNNSVLLFENCLFLSSIIDLHHTYYNSNDPSNVSTAKIKIYHSIFKNCSVKMGRALAPDGANGEGEMYFYNNRCINGKYHFAGALGNISTKKTFIAYSSFFISSNEQHVIIIESAVYIARCSFNVSTSYTGFCQNYYSGIVYAPHSPPVIEYCVYNKEWLIEGMAGTSITNCNWKDGGRNQLKTYENITGTASLAALSITGSETDYIGTDRTGYNDDFSYNGVNWKSYLFDRSDGLFFNNILFDAGSQLDGLFHSEAGQGAEFHCCTIKNFTARVFRSLAAHSIFHSNCISIDYSDNITIERNIFAYNDIGLVLNNSSCLVNHNTFYSNLAGIFNSDGTPDLQNNVLYGNISHSIKSSISISISEGKINLIEMPPANLDTSNGKNITFNPFFKNEMPASLDLHIRTKEEGFDFDSVAKECSSDLPKQDLGAYHILREFIGFQFGTDFTIDRPHPKHCKLTDINALLNITRTGNIYVNNDGVIIEEAALIWEALEEADINNLRNLWYSKDNRIQVYEFPETHPEEIKDYFIDKRQALNYERTDNFNSGENIYVNIELKLIRKAENQP